MEISMEHKSATKPSIYSNDFRCEARDLLKIHFVLMPISLDGSSDAVGKRSPKLMENHPPSLGNLYRVQTQGR